MAHFRGTLKGTRGDTSRLGTIGSGLKARLASWEGAVEVRLYYDGTVQKDMCEVVQRQHNGAGVYRTVAVFPVGD